MVVITGYEILEQIYESSNSVVYRGRRVEDNQPVIFKVLKQDCLNPLQLTRYKQEYEIIRNLEHQGIIKVYDLQQGNFLMMILEDFGGESLKNLLSENKNNFSLVECLEIACKITDSLAQIHAAQVIHKDINPSNIVFNPVTKQLKIIDFGISTRLGSEHTVLKSANALEGTLTYISPEQTGRMNRCVDYRTDFYSLGVTLYELFTRQLPFTAEEAMEVIHCHLAKQPVPAHEINSKIPRMVSAIVMKLMAKTAEERYQSVWGIKADLETCSHQLQNYNCIIDFDLGKEDISHQFNIPQKLYGREQEISSLLTVFERVVNAVSKTEMILVKGYSGIGKSALVKEIYQPITREHGYFLTGKFDQFQRNIPYSAVVKALSGLVKQLLTESELQQWKQKLLSAIQPNAQVIIDVIPEVELIIGKQPDVEELSGIEAQNRFNSVFQSFIRFFCQPEHPLVLFIDDLQWADSASLQLIELMMKDEQMHHLLLIGAYRDNEVDAAHPLIILLEKLQADASINQIHLTPLNLDNITYLIADTLKRDIEDVKPLAKLVSDKTGGNPFFVNQFLHNLYSENLIYFHTSQGAEKPRWEWDISQIEAMDITDNVVDLMISKLIKLPKSTQQILRLAACIGNRFKLNTLAIVSELSVIETFQHLKNAIKEGFVLPTSGLEFVDSKKFDSQLVINNFKFLHDKVQQAAYSLIAEYEKSAIHLQIGWLLHSSFSQKERVANIFELVDHFNLARKLIIDDNEKLELVKLNLTAAKKAKDAIAYSAAKDYLTISKEELSANSWLRYYELTLDIYKQLAEIEYLNGNFEKSQALINVIIEKAKTPIEKADIHNLLAIQYTVQGKLTEAIEASKKGLQYLGVDLSPNNLDEAFKLEATKANQLLQGKEIASLINQPDMIVAEQIVAISLYTNIYPACYLADQKLYALIVIKALNLSIEYGNLAESIPAYSNYGVLLGSIWGEFQKGNEFGKLALNLSEKYSNLYQKCKACFLYTTFQMAWVKHIKFTNDIANAGFQAGIESGDLQFSGDTLACQLFNRLHQSVSIQKSLNEANNNLIFVNKNTNQFALNMISGAKLCLLNLSGETKELNDFDSVELTEAEYLQNCWEQKSYMPLFYYYTFKSFILYLHNQPVEALEAVIEAEQLLEYVVGIIAIADQNLFQSLILTTLYPAANFAEQKQYWHKLERNQNQMRIWANNCEANFLHKYLIIEAEIARISGNKLEAMELYDLAIDSAKTHGFIQNEALANELAAKFWLGMNQEDFAQIYLRKAYNGYKTWGAKYKVEDLENQYSLWLNPSLTKSTNSLNKNYQTTTSSITTTTDSADSLDIDTVFKVSQTISSEILLAELIDKLMKTVIENAGAQTGCLIFVYNGDLVIEAVINAEEKLSAQNSLPITAFDNLPISVINYVVRTHTDVLLDEANKRNEFADDNYFIKQKPKSVLCIPILHQGKLIGILYLENNLTAAAFPPQRLQLLKLICSQAAISIKNATLYNTLEQKVRERTQQLTKALENLQAAQKQLVESEKMAALGSLVAGVAHEINTPVGTSITAASTLKHETTTFNNDVAQGKLKRSSLNNYLETANVSTDLILNNLNRASDLIQSFKQVAVDSSHLEKREFAIKPYIEEILNSLAPKFKNTALTFTVEGDNDIKLNTYPGAVAQIVTNLAMNSLNHAYPSAEKGQLRFQITQQQDKVTIEYSDDGCGIPPENLTKIFEPFFTTARNQGGTGLGLHIVYNLVTQKLQGTINVKSDVNLGTIFIIALPLG